MVKIQNINNKKRELVLNIIKTINTYDHKTIIDITSSKK